MTKVLQWVGRIQHQAIKCPIWTLFLFAIAAFFASVWHMLSWFPTFIPKLCRINLQLICPPAVSAWRISLLHCGELSV